jgi:N-acetyl sugar amidotransferase
MNENNGPLEVYYGLPDEVVWCKRCVINNQRPSSAVEFKNRDIKDTVLFDENGVCDSCNFHDEKYNVIDWEKREEELTALCDKHRGTDGSYDVIVPGSGGKDSVYVAHVLKEKYGMHPLTVTWPPNMYTDIGRQNFEEWLATGFANITYYADQRVHRLLTREAFLNLGHPFQPFIIGQKQVAPKTALNYGIKLIMHGECSGENGSGADAARVPTMSTKFFTTPRGQEKDILLGGNTWEQLLEKGFTPNELLPYIPVTLEDVEAAEIEVHHMSYYTLWRPQDNFYYAVENCGFMPNPERTDGTFTKYPSLDDKIDGMHFYLTYLKFGMGRCAYDASQEVRNHHIDRDEAVALMRKYDGEFPKTYFKDFLEYCNVDEDTFWQKADSFRSPHIWKKDGNDWILRHPVE